MDNGQIMGVAEMTRLMAGKRPPDKDLEVFRISVLAGNIDGDESVELLASHGWITKVGDGYDLTPTGTAVIETYLPAVAAVLLERSRKDNWMDEAREKARKRAQEAVEDGYLKVVDGYYQLTEKALVEDGEYLVEWLRGQQHNTNIEFVSYLWYQGCSVDDVFEDKQVTYNLLSRGNRSRMRARIIYDLSKAEREALGIKTKSLSDAEKLIVSAALLAAKAKGAK